MEFFTPKAKPDEPLGPQTELHKPVPLRKLTRPQDDCLSCRIVGGGAFIGLGAYSFWSGMYQINAQRNKIIKSGSMFGNRSRQAGITTIALMLSGIGVYRLTSGHLI